MGAVGARDLHSGDPLGDSPQLRCSEASPIVLSETFGWSKLSKEQLERSPNRLDVYRPAPVAAASMPPFGGSRNQKRSFPPNRMR